MSRRPPGSTRTDTLFPSTPLFRSPAPRLWGLLWGGEDLSADLGAARNRDAGGAYTLPYQFARAQCLMAAAAAGAVAVDAVSVRSEEHTSELQSLMRNSYAVFCLKKKQQKII